jgi:hypothetical protein
MNVRPLAKIEAALEASFKRENRSIVEIGGLLIEAKEQLDRHGRWLLWLQAKFPHAIRTAQNYMAAHRFAAKYATVAHLNLAPSALYTLARFDSEGKTKAVKAALREAKTKWVDYERVYEIYRELTPALDLPPPPAPPAAAEEPPDEAPGEEAPGEEESGEEEPPDDDRPPPTPPPGLNPRQAAQLRQFEEAAKALLGLAAKPSREFATADMAGFDLETIADFLRQVAKEKSKAVEAADQPQAVH